ncbi:MAG: GyrI-like domain-containing protein [Candidatus Saccharibacteria bacterium]
MGSIDFKKDPIYKATTEPRIIEVPPMLFAMIDGEGAPETAGVSETDFQQAMQALFGIVYAIKFWNKNHPTPPGYSKFATAPIEGLWWTKGANTFNPKMPNDCQWTVMIRLPEFVTQQFFDSVIKSCVNNKKSDVFKRARLQKLREGTSVQVMHVGPYNQEQTSIDLMHAYAKERSYQLIGKHHELYFGDQKHAAPDKLRTVLRHAVEKL